MKSRTTLVLLVALVAVIAAGAAVSRLVATPRTVILVRHAERADQSQDSLLSPTGEARAGHLAEVLGGLGVRTIYVTQYRRTQQTAQPLAQRLGLMPMIIAAKDLAGRHLQKGQDPVLVVGHNNTIPGLLHELGVQETVELPPEQFNDLFVVVTHRFGRPTFLRLRY